MTRRTSSGPTSSEYTTTELRELPPINSPDDLVAALRLLRETKMRDREAKRAKDYDQRPELGRAIYDLVRAIEAARGANRG